MSSKRKPFLRDSSGQKNGVRRALSRLKGLWKRILHGSERPLDFISLTPDLATQPIRLPVHNHNILLYTTNLIVCLQYISMPPQVRPKTPLSLAIHSQMKVLGVSIHQLAKATDVVYERARTAVTGDAPPGRRLLRDICRVLKLDLDAMAEMLVAEQIRRKYGHLRPRLANGNPELRLVEEHWQFLSPEEKEHVVWLVGRYAERGATRAETVTPIRRIAPRPARTP